MSKLPMNDLIIEAVVCSVSHDKTAIAIDKGVQPELITETVRELSKIEISKTWKN